MPSEPTVPAGIDAVPAAKQLISHEGKEYTTIKEGLAYILLPSSTSSIPQNDPRKEAEAQPVFYNPIQQFNRDLTTLAIRAYGEESMKRKQAAIERKTKSAAARKEKKRKRQEASSEPRKAGKLDDGSTQENTHEAAGHDEMEVEDTENRPEESGAPIPATEPSATEAAPKIPHFTILDALSATGLRALRYAHEIPFVTSVTANDLLPAATDSMKLNIKHNKLETKLVPNTGNAVAHMYNVAFDATRTTGAAGKYDAIDLDPYGTAVPFLDAAVQAVRDGGLLCITCTDAGVWASIGYPEKCFALYGGTPAKGQHSHEAGLRLILHSVAMSASRYGLAMEPLLSLSIDFYARVFVKITKSAADVKFLAGRSMMVYNCDAGCGAYTTQPLVRNKESPNKSGRGTFFKHVMALGPTSAETCEHCGTKAHIAGPMYAGPIHSAAFIQSILDLLPTVSPETYGTLSRIEGTLTTALEELLPPPAEELDWRLVDAVKNGPRAKTRMPDGSRVDHAPFFFLPSTISKVLHCVTPHEAAVRGALRKLGYQVTRSHAKPGSLKTDAPWAAVWHVMREWVRQKSPVKDGALRPGSPGWTILRAGDAAAAGTAAAKEPHAPVGADHGGEKATAEGEAGAADAAAPRFPPIVFDAEIDALGKEVVQKKLTRFPMNPRENWGPMARATGRA